MYKPAGRRGVGNHADSAPAPVNKAKTTQTPAPQMTPALPRTGLYRTLEDYLDFLYAERGLSSNTVKAYRSDITAFIAWLTTDGAEANRQTLARYLKDLRA